MPTILFLFGLRFFFYSDEHLPMHVHVKNGDGKAKIEIETAAVVENNGIKTAIINASFTCHMPDCLEMPYMPEIRGAEIVNGKSSNSKYSYRIGGNSCLSGDFMGTWKFDHELQIRETLIFEDMLHYTTVKTTMFNGIGHPSIGMLHEDGTFELFRQFTYEDYRDRMC